MQEKTREKAEQEHTNIKAEQLRKKKKKAD
jgi:hypothetical protein